MVAESGKWPLAGATDGSGLILRLGIEMDPWTQKWIGHGPKPHEDYNLIKRQIIKLQYSAITVNIEANTYPFMQFLISLMPDGVEYCV